MKSAVFIDVGYLIQVSKIKQIRLDFKKLSDELTNGTECVKTLIYDTVPPDTGDEKGKRLRSKTQMFHTQLRRYKNFEVKLGRLQKVSDEFQQKGVDVTLAVDLIQMSMKKEIDKAIIITADSDFKYAVQQAKKENVIVSLSCFPVSKINGPFRKSFTNQIPIDDALITKCNLFLDRKK